MMAEMPVIAFVPCRKGSERVRDKNTRPFAGISGGLVELKLGQLMACEAIATIVVSTNDPAVTAVARRVGQARSKPVMVLSRPEHLASSETSTDALVAHVPAIIQEDAVILWTHVTSPFVGADTYQRALERYRRALKAGQCDSLMSVTKLQTFLWNQAGPVNYDRQQLKWPKTQTLPVWYEVNSAIFLASRSVYVARHDRIGDRPYFFELNRREGFDIDWEDDFAVAEALWKAGGGCDEAWVSLFVDTKMK